MFKSSSLKTVCLVFRPLGGAAMFCTRAKSFPGGEASEAHFYSGIHYFPKGNIPDICHGRHGHVRVNFFWPV